MNREVEERIVAMYFDNKDFEKNAKATIDTLGQLKDSLNIGEEAEKGFSVFEKIGKTLNFDKMGQSLSRVKTTLSGMKDIFKKVFNLGPLDDAYRALDRFKSHYLDRVLGFDIANKIVSGFENAFRSLTIAPVSAGWDQYQSKMDSVKTIMSSTGESMEVVEGHLKTMTEYANKTIYSLTDMTSNLGKFTNNGVKLEQATQAMMGIANATADAGQGSQAASMAMYNVSQAIGVGKMTSIDWKSLENANVATVKLKQTFIDVAAAEGRVRKETKKVGDEMKTTYWIDTDENGKKLKKSVELTASNFRETLSKGWLDKETMIRTFALYSGQGIDQNTLASWGITDEEEQKRLMQIGEEASKAATEVRTFTKMMDALKESVQSGWAESFQIIFGNMEQGTQLWTKLNEKFDGVLSGISERRNKILKDWAETDERGKSIWTKDANNNQVLRQGAKGGRDILFDSLFELIDIVQDLGSAVSKTFGKVFGTLDGKKLMQLTLQFRDLVKGIKQWFGSMDDSGSRISKLMKGLTGILNIIKVGWRVIKTVFNWLASKLSPVIDFIIDKFATLGDYFSIAFGNMDLNKIPQYLGKVIGDIWNKIKAIFTSSGTGDSPFVSWIKKVWGGFKSAIRELADNLGLGGVIDTVSKAWNTVSGWEGWTAIGQFFSDVWGWISDKANVVINWFTQSEDGEDTGFIKFLKDIASSISSIWGTITAWEGWTAIGQFFSDIWTWITGKAQDALAWFQAGENGEESGFIQFIHSIADGISSIWGTITAWEGWKAMKEFFANTWTWITGKAREALEWFQPGPEGETSGFVKFLQDTKKSLVDAWDQLGKWEGWPEIGKFFSNIWDWVSGFITGGSDQGDKKASGDKHLDLIEKRTEETSKSATAVEKGVGFFERIINAVGGFFEKIKNAVTDVVVPEKVQEFLAAAGKFLEGLLTWVTKLLNSAGNIMNGNASASDWITLAIPALIVGITQIFDYLDNKHLSKIDGAQNFAQKFMEIAGGMLMLAGAVALLTTLDENKVWGAVGVMAALGAVVAVILGIFAKIEKTRTAASEPVTSGERILNNLINTLGKVGMLYVVLEMLPKIIETVGKVKQGLNGADLGKDILDVFLGISALIATISLVFAVIQKMQPNGLDPKATALTAFSLIAAIAIVITGFEAILGLIGGIAELFGGEGNVNKTVKIIGNAGKILRAIGEAIGDFARGFLGLKTEEQKAEETLRTADILAEGSKAFDTEKISGISRMMALIADLSAQSEKIDPTRLDGFAEAMGKLGAGIYEYVRFLAGDDYMQALSDLSDPTTEIYTRLMAFQDLGKKLADLFAAWGSGGWQMSTMFDRLSELADPNSSQSIQQLVQYLNAIVTGLGDLNNPDTGIQFDGLTIATKLVDAIQEGLISPKLPKFDATPIVDSIIKAIGLGDTAIALAVHNMVQSGMNLSESQNGGYPDLSSIFNNDMLTQLLSGGGDFSGLFDTSSLREKLFGSDNNGGIMGEINTFTDSIPNIGEVFKNKGWMDFKDENGNDIDLLGGVQEKLKSLQESLDLSDPITITITPVFDYSNLTAESVRENLARRSIRIGMNTDQLAVDFTGLGQELGMDAIRSKLDDVVNEISARGIDTAYAIEGLSIHMDNIAYAVAQMRLYLDTGLLVGGIAGAVDRELGNRAFLAGRTGVSL